MVIEMVVPTGDKPSLSKLLDLHMLAALPGCERTKAEYSTMLSEAGFKLTKIVSTMSPYSVIEGGSSILRHLALEKRPVTWYCQKDGGQNLSNIRNSMEHLCKS